MGTLESMYVEWMLELGLLTSKVRNGVWAADFGGKGNRHETEDAFLRRATEGMACLSPEAIQR